MNNNTIFKDFSNRYSTQKTLKFELKGIGKSIAFLDKILAEDKQRAQDYQTCKKIIDRFHKQFIETALASVQLKGLDDFAGLYFKTEKTDTEKKQIEKLQEKLRKEVVAAFTNVKDDKGNKIFPLLFRKELIQKILPDWVGQEEERSLLEGFKLFTTYFTGFHENRKNMYSEEPDSTAIGYRLIHENLPRFLDNSRVFQEKIKHGQIDLETLEANLDPILQGLRLEEVFSVAYFNQTLSQKSIEFYNTVLGGWVNPLDPKEKIQGVNEFINLHNQPLDRSQRIPRLKPLHKQILSDRDTVSFRPEPFENDQEVLDAVRDFYTLEIAGFILPAEEQPLLPVVSDLVESLPQANLDQIVLKGDTTLRTISNALYGDWSLIEQALGEHFEKLNPPKSGKGAADNEDKKKKWLKEWFPIADIDFALKTSELETLKELYRPGQIAAWFTRLGENSETPSLLARIENAWTEARPLLETPLPEDKNLIAAKEEVAKIKSLLDSLMDLLHTLKLLHPGNCSLPLDEVFYGRLIPLYDQLEKVVRLFNKVRNYLTRKPYSIEKFKVNFQNSTLLQGWDVEKEQANTALLFEKDGLYFLGIMEKKNNKAFSRKFSPAEGEPVYRKMEYKFFPEASKMIPKCSTQLKPVKAHFNGKDADFPLEGKSFSPQLVITKRIYDLNNTGYDLEVGKMIPKGEEENDKRPKMFQKEYLKQSGDTEGFAAALRDWIDFCKDFLQKYESTKIYDFHFQPSESYHSLDEFYKDVNRQTYQVNFRDVPQSYIDKLVDDGKLFLFQIYNKDFSPHSTGKPNMHTLYWKMLFHPDNLANTVYKLNGQAEVFFRKRSIPEANQIVHPAGQEIARKNPLNDAEKSRFPYPIIKDKRFTLDKFQFHVPISMNFKATENDLTNLEVQQFLANQPVNIIGIDRGERHLLYYTIINPDGKIIRQGSLNTIEDDNQTVNYRTLLDIREREMMGARKNWNLIQNIRDLKAGYLSQVIHRLTKMMIEENAIIVLEDLNAGFIRGRQKVDKQVYQKFEKALIDKLNFLVMKDYDHNRPGGLLHPLQLTGKFRSFREMGKQSGFLFYVPAANTSKIDPATGFVNLLSVKYENVNKARSLFANIETIKYNLNQNYFEFDIDFNRFNNRAGNSRSRWLICTHGTERYQYNPQLKISQKVDVTAELKTLFDKAEIQWQNCACLKQAILQQQDKKFFAPLMNLLALTLMLRHSESGTENDYILSPVADKNGQFFDSRNTDNSLPANSDANGAFNIALKGLLLTERLQGRREASTPSKTKGNYADLFISNQDWLTFAQELAEQRE